jgi:hypothetical protein
MENRPAICSPRVLDSSPARSMLIPASTKVAGMRSEKYNALAGGRCRAVHHNGSPS